MRMTSGQQAWWIGIVLATMLQAQVRQNPPMMYQPPPEQAKPPAPPANAPAKPAAQAPGTAAPPPATAPAKPAGQTPTTTTPAPSTAAQTAPATPAPLADTGTFMVENVSLIEMIDILARRMKINYILDPRVNGKV